MITKIKAKIEKEPLSVKILNYLGETSKNLLNLSVEMMFDPKGLVKKFGPFMGREYYFPREISNLKKCSYFKQQGKKFYLTEKGRIKIIKNILKNRNLEVKKWDGFWLAIIFDIPEASRRERSFLRRELKLIGCKELQKSVWITPFDIEKELLTLLDLWKRDFRGDIRFLKIVKITGEKELKEFFRIK